MKKNINDVNVKDGWKKYVQGNQLIVEQDVEFDIFTFAEKSYFCYGSY